MIDFAYIPAALIARPQWVVWRAEERNGKMTKVPYDAKTGRLAESDNPATWASYPEVVSAAAEYDGIGYVFSADDPYTGVDLDDCIREHEVLPWAEKILISLSSYSEVSPSGTGIKIWVEGKTPGSAKPRKAKIPADIIPPDMPGSIEIYSTGRFFTMTGWHVEGMPREIRSANGALTALYEALKPAPIDIPRAPHRPIAGRKYLERWAQHKIDYAVEQVREAVDGERHNTRYAMARLLGGLIPHGLATDDSIARELFDAQPPKTAAQRSEYKTILDGIQSGALAPLELPNEPEQPLIDEAGYALCPKHRRPLDAAKNGNGWVCRARDSSTERGWCSFWWDGDGYHPPRGIDPETGEELYEESTDFLLNARRSDTGNAECLAQIFGDDLRYCHTRKKWLVWDVSRWAIDEGGVVAYCDMIEVVRARYRACEAIPDLDQRKKAAGWCVGCESTSKLEAALRTAAKLSVIRTTIERWDGNQLIAAALGATIDLRAVVHRAVRREDYLTMQLGAAYDPEALCPRWIQFLDEVFLGNAELIAYVQRAVGYCLTGDTREQKLFLCHGTGANGKSVFLEILSALLGDYAANASFETFDANRRSESSNDLAMLRGKRLVTVIETEEGKRLAEARVKSVTGQDLITCRFLYGEYFSYRPTYKIWLAMNHLPIIRGTDKGIWRRIELIPFKGDFEGQEDKTLAEALRGELDGILQWALEGLRQWWVRGLDTPAIVRQATKQYRDDSDQIGRWIGDRCLVVSNVFLASSTGYKNYEGWCKEVGEEPISQNKWSRRMNEKGFQSNPDTSRRGWLGIGLLDSEDS
jgi:putative DNA primase/helicase